MALFQKSPYNSSDSKPIYTLGLQKTVLIVGLGNIGKQYEGTRHNIGFGCVEALAESQQIVGWTDKKDLKSLIATATIDDTRVILCKPTTMMNLSGEAVQAVRHFYKVEPARVVVVHDELDIPFGQIRTRMDGSDAGHNGIKSLIEHIDERFGRVRVGIGPKKPAQIDSADFVLAAFSDREQKQMNNLLKESTAVLTEFIHSGNLPAETRSFIV